MLSKKQKFTRKTHIGYFIGYNLSNITRFGAQTKIKSLKPKMSHLTKIHIMIFQISI